MAKNILSAKSGRGAAARLTWGVCLAASGCYNNPGIDPSAGEETTTANPTDAVGVTDELPTTTKPGEETEGPDEGTTGPEPSCYSTRDFFADKVWAPLMSTTCIQCHDPTGSAAEKGAKFRLLSPIYPGFIEANLENIRSMAKYEFDGMPLLLAKPLGIVDHGGGQLLGDTDDVYKDIEELLVQLDDPVECPPPSIDTTFPDVQQLTPVETLRKATLHLAGRLPTQAEVDAVKAGGDAALLTTLDALFTEDAFYERLMEMWNDVFLTDRYNTTNGFQGPLNESDWPNVAIYDDKDDAKEYTNEEKARISRAVAREPLYLIEHIVRNDLPFTEILTAPYAILTPDSAWIYGSEVAFDDPMDFDEKKPGTLTILNKGVALPYPHAGILTSPMWLNRFPTTSTNRMRHRARMVYDQFLATDVLALASQALDPDAGAKFLNPTREDPSCAKCHRTIDPVAGAFQMFDANNQDLLLPQPKWYPELFSPGYQFEDMPTDMFATGLQWLAQRIVADPRFSLSVTFKVLQGLTGRPPMAYPTQTADPFYKQQVAAWEAQDQFLRVVAAKFVASNHNIKEVIKDIIVSPYYRAGAADKPTPERAVELSLLGTGRLSTPELLSRKIQATTGVRWGGKGDNLTEINQFRILYGGIDSNAITQRLSDINQLMVAVGQRMAVEVSCRATAFDFTKPAAERKLFPLVEITDTPDTAAAKIKENIKLLHWQLLGEQLEDGDPELARTWDLYVETSDAGVANIAATTESTGLGSCGATKNPNTDEALLDEQKLTEDPDYTVRAWQAVIAYMLMDYRFIYE